MQHDAKARRQFRLTLCLFLIYLAAVTAVILFKFPFRGDALGSTRVIQWVPFFVAEVRDASFFRDNILYNILFFIPFGVFACLLKQAWPMAIKIASIALLSVLYEILQFVLGIGISDTTDLITNTAGGVTGIGIYCLARTVFKEKTHVIINAAATVLTVIVLILFIWALIFMAR